MGKLEKVGAAVVGVLLCIIVFVGVLNHDKTSPGDVMSEADREAASNRPLSRDFKRSNLLDGQRPPKKILTLDDAERDQQARKDLRKVKDDLLLGRNGKKIGGATGKDAPPKKDVLKPKPAPIKSAWPKQYVVKKNDMLDTICRKVYGTRRMVGVVLAANPGLNARRLIPGKTKIMLPAPKESVVNANGGAGAPAKLAVQTKRPRFITNGYVSRHTGKGNADKRPEKGYYIVRKNDSLSTIAQKQLGSIKFTKALLNANRNLIKNPNSLREGWKLKLPNVN